MFLDREDVGPLTVKYLEDRLGRQDAPSTGGSDVVRFLRSQAGLYDVPEDSITVSFVHFDTHEAREEAEKSIDRDKCRLVCRSMSGGTNCFWVCD